MVSRLIEILAPAARKHGGRAVPDLDTWLAEDTVVRPDVVVLLGEHAAQRARPPLHWSCSAYVVVLLGERASRLDIPTRRPALAVEIVSPSNREYDYGTKWEAYRRAGLAEVWRVDPESETVTIQRPGCEDAVHHDRVCPQFAPDLEMDLPALFADVRGLT